MQFAADTIDVMHRRDEAHSIARGRWRPAPIHARHDRQPHRRRLVDLDYAITVTEPWTCRDGQSELRPDTPGYLPLPATFDRYARPCSLTLAASSNVRPQVFGRSTDCTPRAESPQPAQPLSILAILAITSREASDAYHQLIHQHCPQPKYWANPRTGPARIGRYLRHVPHDAPAFELPLVL
jgi:hypothetical protein